MMAVQQPQPLLAIAQLQQPQPVAVQQPQPLLAIAQLQQPQPVAVQQPQPLLGQMTDCYLEPKHRLT
jgi:hypothetical protein